MYPFVLGKHLGIELLGHRENNSFLTSFMHLKLRWEREEDYKQVGEIKAGIRLQDS